jgi:hypothetical protein
MEFIDHEKRKLLEDLSEITVKRVLIELGQLKPYLSLRQAYKMYGEGNVERWRREGLVEVVKDGDKNSKIRIDRIQIECVAKSSNRASYYEHNVSE